MPDNIPHGTEETATTSHQLGASVDLKPDSVILDRFRVIELLGSGGMGSVYKVQHLHLNKMYALKCIKKNDISDVDWRRFEVEAKAANRLDHPNLVKVHDSGLLPEGLPYFVMDLVEGNTLSDSMKNRGMMPLAQALKIFVQVGFAISYAHQKGIIHRDLKPSNIMIASGTEGTLTNAVKVVDFGLAKITGADGFNQQTLTRTGEIFGSPLYMSPEQCMGIAVDHRSDLYSLGCVMYETLTGAPPLMGDSALSTMMKHQSEKPLSLKEASLGIEYPPQLEALVAKLLEKDPADRYQDASTLTAELVSLEQQFKEGGGRTFAPIANVSDSKSTGVAGGAQFNWLGIAAGFAIGLATGYLLARPHTVVVEQQAPKINLGILDSKIHKDLNHYKIPDAEVNDLKPFSVISDNNVRIFHFPKSVIGALSLKTNEIMAKNVIPISDFQPFWFKGNEVLWNQPELLKRFRKDEIKTINFDDCEINLEKLLTYAADITSIADIQLNDTDITDKTLPIIDKFPNLTGLSLKRTNISAEGLLKLKRFKKIRYLNVDNCRNMKPLLKQMKEMPDLYSLGLSRIELNSQDVDELIKNKNVHGLVISGNPNIDDELIKKFVHMKRLENISIVDCNVTGKSIQTFKKFPALKAISLPDWKPEVMERFRTELPYVLIAGSKLRNRQAERMYEEDMKKQGKSKSGYGADL